MDGEHVAAWTMLTTRVLAPNPGPMTMGGTNSYIVRRPDSHRVVVVDPGPLDAVHLRRLVSQGLIELILLTHFHEDHAEAAHRLSTMTGAPVRAMDASHCVHGPPLHDGEEIRAGGTLIRVVATPGHTSDSVCFFLADDRDLEVFTTSGSMLTGDTILGRGSPTIDQPQGSLRGYIRSLNGLSRFGAATVLPGHGPRLDSLAVAAQASVAHRRRRLRDLSFAIGRLDSGEAGAVSVASITDLVYPHVAPEVRLAAEGIVRAQLEYLAESVDQCSLTERAGHDHY